MTSEKEFDTLIESNDFSSEERIALKAMYQTHTGNAALLNNLVIEKLVNKKSLLSEPFSAEEIGFINQYMRPEKDLNAAQNPLPIPNNDFVSKTWALAYKHGFNAEGSIFVLEAATGNFCKYAPKNAANVFAFESNEVCQKIIKATYPSVIIEPDYEHLFIDETADEKLFPIKPSLVIGCAPSGEYESYYAMMGEKTNTNAAYWFEYYLIRGGKFLEDNGLLVLLIDVYGDENDYHNIATEPNKAFIEAVITDKITKKVYDENKLKFLNGYFIGYDKIINEKTSETEKRYRAICVLRKQETN